MNIQYTFDDRMLIENLDYSYVDQVVDNIKRSLSITREPEPMKIGVLLSIHIQSNRPDNFSQFLDDLEAATHDPANVEVVIKIDDTDEAMNELLPKEIARRPFTIRYISTPLDGGFFELWRSMNDMLKVCNPDAYFYWNMNDEMSILNKDWDVMLWKYVGLFPDHIFRLRTSLFRFRNYYDYWENGFAPETSAITTRRWIQYGGNWNPCLGPDTFQQCVAYYFGRHDRFNKHKILREVPIHDFILGGEGAFVGLEGEKLWRRMRGATRAWFRLMSPQVQEEASRRAQKLHAYILAHEEGIDACEVADHRRRRKIVVTNKETGELIREFPYHLSYLRIKLTNLWRCTRFFYYGGGGEIERRKYFSRFMTFLILRFSWMEWCRTLYLKYQKMRERLSKWNRSRRIRLSTIWRLTKKPVLKPAIRSSMKHTIFGMRRIIGLSTVWRLTKKPVLKPAIRSSMKHTIFGMRRIIGMSVRKIRTLPLMWRWRFHDSVYAYDAIVAQVNWQAIERLLKPIVADMSYRTSHQRSYLLRVLLLEHWYGLSSEEVQGLIGRDLALQRFTGVEFGRPLPDVSEIDAFEQILKEHGLLDCVCREADQHLDRSLLPDLPFYAPLKQVV